MTMEKYTATMHIHVITMDHGTIGHMSIMKSMTTVNQNLTITRPKFWVSFRMETMSMQLSSVPFTQ